VIFFYIKKIEIKKVLLIKNGKIAETPIIIKYLAVDKFSR